MRILFFGDIVGNPGITAVSDVLPSLVKKHAADAVVINGENASRGFGLNYRDCQRIRDLGADVITLGNHWKSRSIEESLEDFDFLVRPANVRGEEQGRGYVTLDVKGVALTGVNLLGTAFMKEEVQSPVVVMQELLDEIPEGVILVDYHGESTSEKSTFAYYFDGQVSAVIGTHTHVQTNDAKVLPLGTGFISDAGMCGNEESVIGFEPQSVIDRILFGGPNPMFIAEEGPRCVNAVLLEVDEETYLTRSIRPIYLIEGKERTYGKESL